MRDKLILKRNDVVAMGFFDLARKQVPIKSKKQKQDRLDELFDILKVAFRHKVYGKYDDFFKTIIKALPLILSIFYESKHLVNLRDISKKSKFYLENKPRSKKDKMGVMLECILKSIIEISLYGYDRQMLFDLVAYDLLAYLIYYTNSDLETLKNQAFGGEK